MRISRIEQFILIQKLRTWRASICAPVLILYLLAASSPPALAQQVGSLTQHLNDSGMQMGRDAISVTAPPVAFPGEDRPDTGSFMMNLPLVDLPGRGLNVKLNLNYDSSLYQLDTDHIHWFVKGTDDNPQYPSRGFMLGYGMLIDHNVDTKCSMFALNGGGTCPSSPPGVSYYGGLTFIDETGAKHRFDNGVTVDGSDIRLSTQNGATTLTYPDGTTYVFGSPITRLAGTYRSPTFQYINTVCYQTCTTNHRIYFPVKISDRNGNFITITSSGINITKITDTLGREINFNYDQSSRLVSIDEPGFTPGTRREVVRFFYRTYNITWNFRDQLQNYSGTFQGLSDLYFPGTKSGWHFDYSSYGQIYLVQNLLGMQYDAATNTLTNPGTEIAKTTYSYNGTPLNPNTSLLYTLPNYTQRIDEWLTDPSDPAQPKMQTVYTFAMDYSSEINLNRSITYIVAPSGIVNVIRKRYYKAEDHSVDWSKTWDEGVTLEEKAQLNNKVFMQINNNWEKTANGARLADKTITDDTGQQRKTVYKYYNPNDPAFPGVKNYMNVRETDEYGFDGSLLRKTVMDYVRDSQWTDRWLIKLPKRIQIFEGNSTTPASQVDFEYDTEALTSYSEMVNNLSMMFDSGVSPNRGNVTKVTSNSNAANPTQGITVSIKTKYDIVGNAVEKTDGNNKVALVEYSADNRRAFPTKISSPIPDTSGSNGSMQPLVKRSTYNFNTGLVVETRDENDQPTTYDYSDPINRLKKVSLPDGGSTSYTYSNSPQEISICTVTALDNSRSTQAYQFYNGRGSEVRKQVLFGDGTYSTTDKEYDEFGRLARISNPYIAALNGTLKPNPDNRLWTTTTYDLLWRVQTVKTPDNAEMKTEYEGAKALATDQAGRQRVSKSDEFGRITDVWEIIPPSPSDPNAEDVSFTTSHPEVSKGYHTSYRYDVLNNLRQVQQGVQKRFFNYDSLSKLIAMKLPEQEINSSINYTDSVTGNTQWSMSFDYDGNGNMRHSTDSRGVLTTYTYDSLNRLISRSFSNDPSNTPTSTYKYDSVGVSPVIPNSAGRMTSVSTSGRFVSTYTYDDYDPMGRVRKSTATIESSPPYVMSYAYDLAGNMVSQTYPSERVVITEIDAAGRISGIRKQSSNDYYVGGAPSTNGGRNIQYAAHGPIHSLALGNGLWETSDYSDLRLQLASLKLGTMPDSANRLQIDFGYGTQNNGNLRSQTITLPTVNTIGGSTITQSYDYDWLNRLKVISEPGGPMQSYDYDQYGNRAVAGTVTDPQTPQQLSTYDAATNRLKTKEYDKSGNITREGISQGHSYQFDAENHLYTVDGGAAATFNYDGNGHRVKKVTPAGTVLFIYNAMDQMVAEYGGATPAGTGGTSYYTLDNSGTPRAVTGSNINDASGGIKGRHDYLPFGEEMGARGDGQRNTNQGYVGSGDNVRQKYTGYERDSESGLDYAQARYYGSTQGRFMSVDPSMSSGKAGDPQSWNRYVYTTNNPLKFVDPSGADWGYSRNADGTFDYNYFHGEVPAEAFGRKWQPVVFGPDGTLEVENMRTGNVYRISNDRSKGLEVWLRKDPNITPNNDWDPSCANCKALVDELGGKWGPPVENSIKGMMAADATLIAAPYAAEYLGAFGYDKVVLWSGEGAQEEAEAIAMKEGAWTLNVTQEGMQAEADTAGLEWQEARQIWMRASDKFSRDLTGKIVHVVLRNPSATSIYNEVEGWNLTYDATWRSIIYH